MSEIYSFCLRQHVVLIDSYLVCVCACDFICDWITDCVGVFCKMKKNNDTAVEENSMSPLVLIKRYLAGANGVVLACKHSCWSLVCLSFRLLTRETWTRCFFFFFVDVARCGVICVCVCAAPCCRPEDGEISFCHMWLVCILLVVRRCARYGCLFTSQSLATTRIQQTVTHFVCTLMSSA